MNVAFGYAIGRTGRTATVDASVHIRDLVEQVLFTAPGERVMRPEFGSGLLALAFEPNSIELAATTQFLVQASLQQWLGHLITVESVDVTADEGLLSVTVAYSVNKTRERAVDQFTAPDVVS
jgi:phage baseplate assembly protein W